MATPSSPQYYTLNQQSISPGNTNATPLFSSPTPALSFVVAPLSTNSDTVLVGFGGSALGPVGLSWAPVLSGKYYNLADVYFQLSNSADGVVVQWIT